MTRVAARLQDKFTTAVGTALQVLGNPNWYPATHASDDQNRHGLWYNKTGNTDLPEAVRQRSSQLAQALFGESGFYMEKEIVLAGLLHNLRAAAER